MRALSDLQVLASLRRSGVEYTWSPQVDQVAASGACGTNQAYDRGSTRTFYVEQQACGEDVVVPALLDGDAAAVGVGLRALEWALAQQAADGSFPRCADAFHSTMVFLASAARTVLLVRESPLADRFADRLRRLQQPLLRAARYQLRPAVLSAGRQSDAPYVHRLFVRAVALGLVGTLAGDATLVAAGRRAVGQALSLQTSGGVFPELGGHDSHYQAYGMVFATTWLVHAPHDALRRRLAAALDRAGAWEAGRVRAGGYVSIRGNTRTAGQERTRDGEVKRLNYHTVARALGSLGALADDAGLRAASARVSAYERAHD